MRNLKGRLFAVLIMVACAGLIYYNWRQLATESKYSLKIAAFGSRRSSGRALSAILSGKGKQACDSKG